jgi:hypothetical protein
MLKITVWCAAVLMVFAGETGYSQSSVAILADDLGFDALVSSLLSTQELQEAVDLSPSQLAKLKSVASSIEYAKIRREVDTLPHSGFGDRLMELEKASRNVFAEALTDEQLAALRQLFIEQRHANQFKVVVSAPFILKYCDIGADFQRFNRSVEAVENQYAPAMTSLIQTRVQNLLAVVPKDSQSKLAQLVGDKYYSRDVVRQDVDAMDIPFPTNFTSVLMIEYLLDQKGLGALFKLTDAQKKQIQTLRSESEMDLESVMQISDPKQFKQGMDGLNARNLERSSRLGDFLDNRSKLAVGRFVVQHRLEADPASVLVDNRVKMYLNMSEESWVQYLKDIDVQRSSTRAEVNKILGKMLDSLADKLGQEKGNRLRYLFRGVW